MERRASRPRRDRVLTREEVVELADAIAPVSGIASGIGTDRYGAQLVVQAGRPRGGHREGDRGVPAGRGTGLGCQQDHGAGPRRSARTRTRPDDPARVAGRLPVRGPAGARRLDPARVAAVYAIICKPDPDSKPERYAVIYVGHSDDLSAERFPFRHPRAPCWVRRAGSRWKVYICTYEVPGGTRAHREQISPRADRRSTGPAATRSSTTMRGRTNGSASTPPPPRPPWPAVPPPEPAAPGHGQRGGRAPTRRGTIHRAEQVPACGVNPTASCSRDRRRPDAGRAGSGSAGRSAAGSDVRRRSPRPSRTAAAARRPPRRRSG